MAAFVKRDNLADQVARYMLDYIESQQLEPGDTLPSEVQIGRELQVSRGIVREAFRSLSASGLIEVQSGKPARVGRLGDFALKRMINHALVTKQLTVTEILELRRSVEVGAATLAAERAKPAELEAIRHELAQMKEALEDVERFVECDIRFHLGIAEATQNPLFKLLATALRDPIENSIRGGLRDRWTPASLKAINDLHSEIVDALVQRDPVRAASAMDRHFEEALSALRLQPRRE